MGEMTEQLAITRADEAGHRQVRVAFCDVLQRLGLALQDGLTLSGLADLEHGAVPVRRRDAEILVALAFQGRPCAAEAINLRGECLDHGERQGGRSQRVEHGDFELPTEWGGPLRRPPRFV